MTLSDINITPLLDLAFVLLIIFVITTPLLTQSIELKLPRGVGQPDKRLNKSDIRTVEISNTGYYKFEARQMARAQIIPQLAQDSRKNPNLVVYIRADKDCRYDLVGTTAGWLPEERHHALSLRTTRRPNEPAPKKMRHRDSGNSLLLLLILVFGSAFFNPQPKPDDTHLLNYISSTAVDTALNSGVEAQRLPHPRRRSPRSRYRFQPRPRRRCKLRRRPHQSP